MKEGLDKWANDLFSYSRRHASRSDHPLLVSGLIGIGGFQRE